MFNFNRRVVSVEDMDELCELCSAVGPNTENVIQVPEVNGGFQWAVGQGFSLPLTEIEVDV